MKNYSETRESVDALLQEIIPDMKYHGHGNNIGIWETDDMLDLTKPISDSYWNAKFRLWVFIPNSYGMQIKVEAFIIHVCEWETMFEGYIEDISDIRRILGMQLGLPLKDKKTRIKRIVIMATEEKKLYGFGVNDTSLFGDTFETVDELIEFAQTEYDNENSDYFDDEDQHCILVSAVKRVSPSDFAPSLDDIAEQMTDRFYSEHNIDDDAEASYHPKEEAKKEWKAFVEKYFDIPYTLIGYADVGWYDLKEHRWVEKKED